MQQLGPDAVGQVFEYLKGAQSSQTTVQKSSEAALKTLQSQPGYCSCLAARPKLTVLTVLHMPPSVTCYAA